jgi:hypothetical protein
MPEVRGSSSRTPLKIVSLSRRTPRKETKDFFPGLKADLAISTPASSRTNTLSVPASVATPATISRRKHRLVISDSEEEEEEEERAEVERAL